MKYFLFSYRWHYEGSDIIDSSFGPAELQHKINAESGSAIACISGETVTIVTALKAVSDLNPTWIICPMLFQEISKEDYDLYQEVKADMGKLEILDSRLCDRSELLDQPDRFGICIDLKPTQNLMVLMEDGSCLQFLGLPNTQKAFVPMFRDLQFPTKYRGWHRLIYEGKTGTRYGYYRITEKP